MVVAVPLRLVKALLSLTNGGEVVFVDRNGLDAFLVEYACDAALFGYRGRLFT